MRHVRLLASVLALLLVALLSACAQHPSRHNGSMAPPRGNVYERQVLAAMSAVQVNDAQRLSVLEAFDQLTPALKAADADATRLRQRWDALDARAPNYPELSTTIATDSGAAARQRLLALSAFNQRVAATLSEAQWQQWSAIMSADEAAYDQPAGGPGAGGGGRRRR